MFVNHNDFAKVFYCVMSKIIFSKPLKIFTYVECQGFKLHLMYSLILEKKQDFKQILTKSCNDTY